MKKDKQTEIKDKSQFRHSAWAGLLLVFVAALTLEATSLIQYYFAQKGIREEASLRAESELENTKLQIRDVIDQAEAAVRNSVWIARWCLDYPDSLGVVATRIVQDNPVVVGSTVALVPGYNKELPLFAPYACRVEDGDEVVLKSLATEAYDYPHQEWFAKPVELESGYWSEPYIDTGGGEILMTTYSLPIRDKKGRIAAVLTADISLGWLKELVNSLDVYPNAFGVMLSRSGQIMISPTESLSMRQNIREYRSAVPDTAAFGQLADSMLAGKSGHVSLFRRENRTSVYFAPVERTNWSMAVVIPESEIYGAIRRMGLFVKLLQIVGLLMLLLILRSVARNQVKLRAVNEKKERMEHELQIGHEIQMSMLPKTFPPFPERKDIDMSAILIPAKAVGGDLYDFYMRDGKLFFCIGDVSGKGVPASLVMAVTRSLFRTVSAHEKSPQRIVTLMNQSMSDMNENNMFVTFFCGVIDMATGHMRYCNAGHNPPLLFTNKVSSLPVLPNLPLGVMGGVSFQEQELDLSYDDALFLYTDGVTEAENTAHELFGEARMEAVLHTRRDAQGHLEAMRKAVSDFVGDAPQSDDLTMLFIHYLNDMQPDATERHLILHNNIQQIPQLADFIETIANEMHLEQGLAMSLNLALEEAVTNVILYAYPEGSDGLVDIEAILGRETLRFIISDSGKPFDPTAAPEADVTLGVEDRPIGGLGIYLVRNIMDVVSYERTDGKNILSMTKRL